MMLDPDWAMVLGLHYAYFKESTVYEGNVFYILGLQLPGFYNFSPLLNYY